MSDLRDNLHSVKYWRQVDRETYRCPDCGRLESHPDVDVLEVHHKDRDPSNGDLPNLIALCRHCHYVRHGRDPPESPDDWKARIHTRMG